MKRNNYFSIFDAYCMVIVQRKVRFIVRFLIVLLILNIVSVIKGRAGVVDDGGNDASPAAYDEIPVHVLVSGYKMFYLDAIYTHDKLLYINIEDLFKILNIAIQVEPAFNRVSGFIENESKTYSIDYLTGQVKVGNKIYSSPKGLIKESGAYYVESSLFTEAFGITLGFNYRSMNLTLKSSFELPVVKQIRIDQMRSNLAKVQGTEIADTVLQRNYHLFKFGTLDWLINANQITKETANNHFGFGLGAELLYGEADVSLNYYNQYKFDGRQLQYIWRWVDNENKIIKQAQVGKITNQTISFINSQVIGAVVRNSPTTVRKANGYFPINETTEPNWTVELYINNVLVNYTQADASGAFTFNVPIVYGYNTLKLKFYGPMGEERTEERTMNVPYTVMPAGEFEYSLSAGVVQDSTRSRLGKGEFNYGVNRILTVGGGIEYLSSIPNSPYIPYAKATIQPFSKLTLNGEYAYGVRTSGLMNYYLSKDVLLEIIYTKYVEGQLATRFNADVEQKVRLSFPLRYKKINGFARLEYTQLDYREFKYNQANALLSVYYKQFNVNSSTQLNWIDQQKSYITDDLTFSYRFGNGLIIRPSVRFNINQKNIMNYKAEVEKKISIGYLSASYERNYSFNDHFINLSFKYDLPFARTNISASHSQGKFSTSQSAMGSLAFGADNYTNVSNNPSMSKGGILLYPFLDANQNGIFDKGEHMVKLNGVKISGGRPIFSEKDSIIRIPDLSAFTNYRLEFMDKDLETISWRFKNKIYQVLIDPNQFKRIDIPVIPVGEVSGMVYLDKDNSIKGLGRITIKIYEKATNNEVAETLSESDGYVYYLGLAPGDYYACVDSLQLANLEFSVNAPCREFSIKISENGDIVDGIDFVLRPLAKDSLDIQSSVIIPETEVPANKQKTLQPQPDLIASVPKIMVFENEQKTIQLQSDSIVLITKTEVPVYEQKTIQLQPDAIILIPKTEVPVSEQKTIQLQPDSIILIPKTEVPVSEQKAIQLQPDSNILIPKTEVPVSEQKTIQLQPDSNILIPKTEVPVYEQKAIQLQPDSIVLITKTEVPISEQKAIRLQPDSNILIPKAEVPAAEQKTMQLQPDSIILIPKTEVPVYEQKIVQFQPEKHALVEQKDSLKSLKNGNKQTDHNTKLKEQDSAIIDSIIFIPADTLFKVQLLALSKPIKDKNYFAKLISDVPGLTIVEQKGDDGLYHYSTQATSGIEETRQLRRTIMKTGWKDSFVAIYAGESLLDITYKPKYRRIVTPPKVTNLVKTASSDVKENVISQPGTEVLKTKSDDQFIKKQIIVEPGQSKNQVERILEVKDTTALIPGDTIFRVQLLALSAPIKIKDYFGLLLSRMPGLKIAETYGADGLYHYSAGSFSKIEDARSFNLRIRNNGWIDSFISSYFTPLKKE